MSEWLLCLWGQGQYNSPQTNKQCYSHHSHIQCFSLMAFSQWMSNQSPFYLKNRKHSLFMCVCVCVYIHTFTHGHLADDSIQIYIYIYIYTGVKLGLDIFWGRGGLYGIGLICMYACMYVGGCFLWFTNMIYSIWFYIFSSVFYKRLHINA